MEVFKRGTGILPVKNMPFPTKCRKESRARCPCHAISQLPRKVTVKCGSQGVEMSVFLNESAFIGVYRRFLDLLHEGSRRIVSAAFPNGQLQLSRFLPGGF
jgi:hypothetical protein